MKGTKRSNLVSIIWKAAKLSGLAALLGPANPLLTNLMLFHPEKDIAVTKATIEEINQKFTTTWTDEFFEAKDGTKLHGWWIQRKDARKTFLISHGNSGNLGYRMHLISTLLDCGANVFAYDYRGFGSSNGSPTPEGIADDGLSAYDYLVSTKNVSPDHIVLYGESLGCAVSTLIGQHRPVAGIVLQSGFSTIVEAAGDRLPWMRLYPEAAFPQRFLDNVTAYKSKHPPLLLLHGEKDWILPARYSKQIFATAIEPKQLVILPECAHNDVHYKDTELSKETLKQFLSSLLISQTVAHNKFDAQDIICDEVKVTACTK